jgi:hypothetical protein
MRQRRRASGVRRAGDERDARARGGGGGGDCEALAARGAVGDHADWVDWLVGWAGGDEDVLALSSSPSLFGEGGSRARGLTEGPLHRLRRSPLPETSSGRILRQDVDWLGSRPGPNSPHAIGPSSGSSTVTPRLRRVAILAWVAGCCHMRTFIAGATTTGLSVASRTVVARSSAIRRPSGDEVGGGRADEDQVGGAAELDVAHFGLVLQIPQRGVDRAFGKRGEAHRGDEVRAACRQHRGSRCDRPCARGG